MIREVLDWHGGSQVTKRSVLGRNVQSSPARYLSANPGSLNRLRDSSPLPNKSGFNEDLDAKVKRMGALRAQAHMHDQAQGELLRGNRVFLKGEFGSTSRRSAFEPFTFGQVFRVGDGRLISIVPGKLYGTGDEDNYSITGSDLVHNHKAFPSSCAKSGSRIVVEHTLNEDTSPPLPPKMTNWQGQLPRIKHVGSGESESFRNNIRESHCPAKNRAVRQRPKFARCLAARLTEVS